MERNKLLIQGISDNFGQAEGRTEETKRFIRDIRRITPCKFTSQEKIPIVLEGFRRDAPIRGLCRREGIYPSTHYAYKCGTACGASAGGRADPAIIGSGKSPAKPTID